MKRVGMTLGLVLCWAVPGYCDDQMKVDTSGKGAVLCVHAYVSYLYEFARLCRSKETKKIEALKSSLDLYEGFISRNAKISLEEARRYTEKNRKHILSAEISLSEATCESVVVEPSMWAEFVDGLKIDELKENTREVLSIDREPLMNPCT